MSPFVYQQSKKATKEAMKTIGLRNWNFKGVAYIYVLYATLLTHHADFSYSLP